MIKLQETTPSPKEKTMWDEDDCQPSDWDEIYDNPYCGTTCTDYDFYEDNDYSDDDF